MPMAAIASGTVWSPEAGSRARPTVRGVSQNHKYVRPLGLGGHALHRTESNTQLGLFKSLELTGKCETCRSKNPIACYRFSGQVSCRLPTV